jgi:hypothetical protein
MRGRVAFETNPGQANLRLQQDPSSVGLSPDTFSRKGRRETERSSIGVLRQTQNLVPEFSNEVQRRRPSGH